MKKSWNSVAVFAGALACAVACLVAPTFAQQMPSKGEHAQAPKGKASPADRTFATEAAQGGLMEVELGRLAIERANSADVKKFGQRMVDDHSAANDKLKQAATAAGINVPATIGEKHKKMVSHLQTLKGDAFDRAYMQHMVSDHKQDVAAFEKQSKSGMASSLKEFAGATLPTLQEHFREAQRVAKTLGGGSR